ncbi:MAG TPA: hemolysin family protein [Terriglobia bacterium]|nr:hemolysin family protein [Terriglobia bacterium]
MSSGDDSIGDLLKIALVLLLVLANGFFVAAEFSLVAVRRSRVAELVAQRRRNAIALSRAIDHLDANLAATQLGITISSLALGWVGEPALAHLVEPLLVFLPSDWVATGSHTISVAVAFAVITSLHIVLGELAPKSFALQKSEPTALLVVRPLGIFLFLLRPAIFLLNGLGNLVLRLFGLKPGEGEETLHSPEEIRLLVTASGEAGLLHQAQQEVVERVIGIGERRISDYMTPRPDVVWIDANDDRPTILKRLRECRHALVIVSRGSVDDVVGILRKQDLFDQLLDGGDVDPLATLQEPLIVPEGTSLLQVLEHFKKKPVRMAVIVDEYGGLEGIVTQTDLLEAIAGDIPSEEGDEPEVTERADGSLLIDGMMAAADAFDRLGIRDHPEDDFHTIAGFALFRLGRIPVAGDHFEWDGWRFEIVDMDGRRIDKLLVSRLPDPDEDG